MKSLLPFLLSAALASAQPSIESTVNELFKVRSFAETAISPDGKNVSWVESDGSADGLRILLRAVGSTGKPARITAGNGAHKENGIAWSADSTRLAFLSDAGSDNKQKNLYVAALSAPGKARRLAALDGASARPRWSPDGKRIAILFSRGAARFGGALEAVEPEVGDMDSQVFDQRLAIIDAQTGALHEITPNGLSVHEFDWAPDSRRIVYTAAPSPADANWWVARLYAIDVDSESIRELYKPATQITVPKWSPDGTQIAFISGLMSDEGVTGGDVFLMKAEGGEARNLTAERKSSASWITWLSSSKRLMISEFVKGSIALATIDTATGSIETQYHGEESFIASGDGFAMADISLASDGITSAMIRSSFTQAPEVWAGPIGRWSKVTSVNESLHPLWGKPKSVEWTSDGFSVQGWLLLPAGYDPSKRYPMVVYVHGGPASVVLPQWHRPFFNLATLSSQGYFVFYPNPRGSFGQGEAFTAANREDFGQGDLRDILSGVDQVLKTYPIDDRRVGIAGWSYGGFMTMWAVTQTNRFKAAVAGAGIANWQSYYGENAIDAWMIPYFGASVYDNPAVYAKSSPINYVKNVKTPTLVVVGERDGECPAPQSFEFWHALKAFDVKTKLVVYPGEGHGFRDAEHMRDLMKRTLGWFNENLK